MAIWSVVLLTLYSMLDQGSLFEQDSQIAHMEKVHTYICKFGVHMAARRQWTKIVEFTILIWWLRETANYLFYGKSNWLTYLHRTTHMPYMGKVKQVIHQA